MKAPSKKRQELLRQDEDAIRVLYIDSVKRWGEREVERDLTRLWDLRCIRGMNQTLPFGSLQCKTLAELLWIAKEVCHYGARDKSKFEGEAEEEAPAAA